MIVPGNLSSTRRQVIVLLRPPQQRWGLLDYWRDVYVTIVLSPGALLLKLTIFRWDLSIRSRRLGWGHANIFQPGRYSRHCNCVKAPLKNIIQIKEPMKLMNFVLIELRVSKI